MQLKQMYNCAPVFIDPDVRDKYYKGEPGSCCKHKHCVHQQQACTHQQQISHQNPSTACTGQCILLTAVELPPNN